MVDQMQLQMERQKALNDWGKFTVERLVKSLQKKGIGYSNSLLYSIHHILKGAGGDVTSIQHMFNVSGKFVDMGVGRGQKIEDVKGNADLISVLGHGRRPKKWFSKTYYSQVHALQEIMAEKYGEQGARLITEIIKEA